MNPLNMPGFTADASLYLTGGSYRSVAAQSNSSGSTESLLNASLATAVVLAPLTVVRMPVPCGRTAF